MQLILKCHEDHCSLERRTQEGWLLQNKLKCKKIMWHEVTRAEKEQSHAIMSESWDMSRKTLGLAEIPYLDWKWQLHPKDRTNLTKTVSWRTGPTNDSERRAATTKLSEFFPEALKDKPRFLSKYSLFNVQNLSKREEKEWRGSLEKRQNYSNLCKLAYSRSEWTVQPAELDCCSSYCFQTLLAITATC